VLPAAPEGIAVGEVERVRDNTQKARTRLGW